MKIHNLIRSALSMILMYVLLVFLILYLYRQTILKPMSMTTQAGLYLPLACPKQYPMSTGTRPPPTPSTSTRISV